MPATIVSRTISSILDKKVALSNGFIAREMSIGSDWTKLRIGMRLSVDLLGGSSNLVGVKLYAGLCSGTANTVGQATTTNFIGVRAGGATGEGYTYAAGPPKKITRNGGGGGMMKKVGSTITAGSADGNLFYNFADVSANVRLAWLLEITKGSPNYTAQVINNNNGTLGADISYTSLASAMDAGTMAGAQTALGGVYGLSGSLSLAFDEVAGALNAVNISWSHTSAKLEVSEVLYARIA
jgi:hypothetical protein